MAIIGSLPFTLTNGTTADATQVMANFNSLLNSVNANAASITGVQAAIYNYAADTGTVNAIIVSPSNPPSVLTDGMEFRTKIANTNTSQTVTAQIGGLAALPVVIDQAGTLPIIGSLIQNMYYRLVYSSALNKFILVNPSAASRSYTGTATGLSTAPTCTVTARVTADSSLVTLRFGTGITGTSNAGSFTITGLPADLVPAGTQGFFTSAENNTTSVLATLVVTASSSVISLGNSGGVIGAGLANWTASGTKAFANDANSSVNPTVTYSRN